MLFEASLCKQFVRPLSQPIVGAVTVTCLPSYGEEALDRRIVVQASLVKK
jgi:hypothetical protein